MIIEILDFLVIVKLGIMKLINKLVANVNICLYLKKYFYIRL